MMTTKISDAFPITWEMIEHDLQAVFGRGVATGPSRGATLIGDGKGFASTLYVLKFDWSVDDEEILPPTAVIKITTAGKLHEITEAYNLVDLSPQKLAADFHDTELNVYKHANEDPDFGAALKIPKYFCGRPFDEHIGAGYFVMEHLESFEFRNLYHRFNDSVMYEVMEIIAKLAAYSFDHPEFLPKISRQSFTHFSSGHVDKEKISSYFDFIQTKYPDRASQVEILRKSLVWFEDSDTYEQEIAKFNSAKTAVHGDIYPANVVWDKSPNGELSIRRVIDWQLAHVGNPYEDIVLAFISFANAATDARTRSRLLQHYFETATKGVSSPWRSEEEFVEALEKAFPVLGIVMMPQFPAAEDFFAQSATDFGEEGRLLFRERMFACLDEAERCMRKHYT